jgi:hypothetical protein
MKLNIFVVGLFSLFNLLNTSLRYRVADMHALYSRGEGQHSDINLLKNDFDHNKSHPGFEASE